MSDLNELKQLAEAATPGPWGYDGSYVCPARVEDGTTYVESWRSVADCSQAENTKFIAAANPAAILALIAENERLSGECEGCPMEIAEALRIERDQLKAENERLRQGVAGDFDLDAWIEWAKEAAKLRAENEALRKGIDPAWSLMDQSLLIDHLRLNTNFAADKVGAMIQFAVECAQYVELHPSQGDKSGG